MIVTKSSQRMYTKEKEPKRFTIKIILSRAKIILKTVSVQKGQIEKKCQNGINKSYGEQVS